MQIESIRAFTDKLRKDFFDKHVEELTVLEVIEGSGKNILADISTFYAISLFINLGLFSIKSSINEDFYNS